MAYVQAMKENGESEALGKVPALFSRSPIKPLATIDPQSHPKARRSAAKRVHLVCFNTRRLNRGKKPTK